MATGYQLFIVKDGSKKLGAYPWQGLPSKSPKVVLEEISWGDLNVKLIDEAASKYRLVFVASDPSTPTQQNLITELANRKHENVVLFSINDKLEPSSSVSSMQLIDAGLSPLYTVAFVERCILLKYYQLKYELSSADEIEWLTRLERVFDFTTDEILLSDKTASAYENLVLYEQRLSQEQRRVNEAMVNLHEYRDRQKKDWIKERQARDSIEALMSGEIKDRNEQLKAQEMLLQYTAKEKKALYTLIELFREKGSLSRDEVEQLLQRHDVLISDIERLTRANQAKN